jgi:hypothetical protein
MDQAHGFRQAFAGVETSADFSTASVRLNDDSCLHFCHRVAERSVKAEPECGQAASCLKHIVRFRLNGKHLEILFGDGSRWELRFR